MAWFGHILWAALTAAIVLPVAARADEVLRVALTRDTPVFSYAGPDGQPAGLNIDIARLLCERIEAKCELTQMPLAELIEAVSTGRVDIGFGTLLKTPEREARMLFSRPYFRTTSSFIGPTGTPPEAAASGLAERRVAAQRSSRQSLWLKGRVKDTSLLDEPTVTAALDKVRSGDADLALVVMVTGLAYLRQTGPGLDFIGQPLTGDGLGGDVHITLPRDRAALARRLDGALEAALADGTIHAVGRQYLPFDIF